MDKSAKHHTDLHEFIQDDGESQSFGKIEKFALSASQKLLAIYSNSEVGDLIVLKSDLTQELNRLKSGMVGAENLVWCGNDTTVLEVKDQVVMVGPGGECNVLELGNPKSTGPGGVKCLTEIDGLRIVNGEGTFFLERVQEHVIETFKIAAITPAAKLLNAIRNVDFGIPRAD